MIIHRVKERLKFKKSSLLAAWRKRLLGRHGFGIVCETANGLFAVDPEDLGVGGHLLEHGQYGREELELLGGFITPDTKVLIVGAHIGSLAIPIARKAREICAIEANPNTFRLLVANLALNHVTNAKVAQIAASDKRETLSFLVSRANSGGSKRVPKIKDAAYYYDRPEAIFVEAYPLDQYLEEAFDIVLMDIEGSEVFALKGMSRILSTAAVLQVEFLPHHLRNVSGVSVRDFLAPIELYFGKLFIPSRHITVQKRDFLKTLQTMYDKDEGDNGIIFTKA